MSNKSFLWIRAKTLSQLISSFLIFLKDQLKRLGNLKNGSDDVKHHRWFKSIDWEDVYNKKLQPPIIPTVSSDGDPKNFDDYPETDWRKVPGVTEHEQSLFSDF